MKAVLITSSILIILIAALRPVLRGKIDPRIQYAIWLVAALRLLIPVNLVTSAYSALALLERTEEPPQIIQTIGQTAVPIPAMSYQDAYDQALREYHQDRPATASFTDLDEVERRAQELQAKPLTLSELAAKCAKPLWLGGAAAMALWFLLVNFRLRRKLRAALPVETDCPLPVYVTPELPSPCLCGAVRPKIYVTPAALSDSDRLRHVLTHELTHFRHRDHWWALVRCACLCLYWFDPLVWWAAALSRQDCELACDEGAIRRLGEGERIPYGRTLVGMIAAGRNSLLQTATTMTGGKRRVKERVSLIARRPKTVAAAALALAIVLGLAVGCTFTGAPEGSPEPDPALSDATTDNLRERLMDVPEELRSAVEASASGTKAGFNDIALVSYWRNGAAAPESQDIPAPAWLLSVHRWQRGPIDTHHGWPSDNDDQVREVIARDEGYYYTIERPVDIRFAMEDAEDFTAAYQAIREYAIKTVLSTEGVEPFRLEADPPTAQEAVQTAVNRLMAAPSVKLTLAPAGTTYAPDGMIYDAEHSITYSTVPSKDYFSDLLSDLPTYFQWEYAPYSTAEGSDALLVSSEDGTVSLFLSKGSYLVLVQQDGETNCYKGQYLYSENGSPPSPAYDRLRRWFDEVELNALRAPHLAVPNQGQSHEEIALQWASDYEGAYTKCAPGGSRQCSFMQVTDVRADLPDWLDQEGLEELVRSHNFAFTAENFGKTWFGFSYSTVFVPVDRSTANGFWVGNTGYYEGDADWAPEGALTYSRVGYMWLTDEGWTCMGTGTGW